MDAPNTQCLEILYKSGDLVAVNKPSGMAVHRGWSDDLITVSDIVRDEIVGAPIFGVHRLDRATSGVLLYALNAQTAAILQTKLALPTTYKRYIALVRGPMREACVLDHPLSNRSSTARVDAITEFEPLTHVDRWTLVKARPRTGRLHQIRKHLKHLSHPIVGDVKYGKGEINRMFRERYNLNRLALHAIELSIELGGQTLTISAPPPPDLAIPLQNLGIDISDLVQRGYGKE